MDQFFFTREKAQGIIPDRSLAKTHAFMRDKLRFFTSVDVFSRFLKVENT